MPRCSQCGKDKPSSSFYMDRGKLRSECKTCHDALNQTAEFRAGKAAYMREYRRQNQAYRQRNIARSSERRRERKREQKRGQSSD